MNAHALTVEVDDAGTASGNCSCGYKFGPHQSGAGSITGLGGALHRISKEWTGASVVEADHRCHIAWEEALAAKATAAA